MKNNMRMMEITPCDLTDLNSKAFDSKGNLVVLPAMFWKCRPVEERLYFMWRFGIYVLPTLELIAYLRHNIIGSAVEIGAGVGAIGRALGIPITDSKMQERPDVALMYFSMQQPLISYPDDIEKLAGEEAVDKYNPDTVIGAFVTHKWVDQVVQGNYWGVQEEYILAKCKRYINIGNAITHRHKPILKIDHQEGCFDWLITRDPESRNNRIFTWTR